MKKLSTTLLADVVPSETGKLRFTGFVIIAVSTNYDSKKNCL